MTVGQSCFSLRNCNKQHRSLSHIRSHHHKQAGVRLAVSLNVKTRHYFVPHIFVWIA